MSTTRPSFARATRCVRRRAVPVALALTAWPSSAFASGFLTDQFGSDQAQPALGNTYSVYFNPAAMAGMQGTEVTVDGVIAGRTVDYTRSASALSPYATAPNGTPLGGPLYTQVNTGKAHLFNVLSAPYAGFVTDFGGSHFRLGVAAYVPFGGLVTWDKAGAYAGSAQVPGAYDGPQRWSTISASTKSIYATAAVAYRFDGPRIGVGASASVIRTDIADTRAHNGDGSDDILGPNGIKEGRTYLNMSGIQASAAVGVYWEPTADRTVRVGLSYTSQPNFGEMRLNGSFKLVSGAAGSETETPADFLQSYPDLMRFGVAWRVTPDTELRADAVWQRWSQFKYQCVVVQGASCGADGQGASTLPSTKLNLPRAWNDSVRVRAGVAYWVSPATELFGSAAVESSPVSPSHEDPLIFDSTRIYGTIGTRHAFSRHLSAQLSYTYVYFLPVTVTDSAYNNYVGPSKSPSANGDYSSELYYFDVAVSYRF
jgi:long-chain fatty acid transport protein